MAISPELIIKIAGNSQRFDAELKKLEVKALETSKRMSDADDRIRKKAIAENTRALEQSAKLNEKNLIASYQRIAAGLAVTAAGAGLAFREFVKLEDALIGVIKTTDIAGAELQKFKENIKGLSSTLGQSQESLFAIAETAGQLGVRGADNLTKFTETIAKLNVASKTLQGEAAASALSRILTITGEGFGNVDRFASVIARLGDNFATTEAQIADMTLNIAQAGGVFRTSATEAAAIGAAFSQLGIQSELARSTFTQFGVSMGEAFSKGGEKLQAFIAITGMTEEQLRKTFKESPTEVFQAFIGGLDQVIKSGGNAADVLEIFGLNNLRTLPVLTTAAKGHAEVARALGLARTEYQENTKLNEEFARRTEASSFKLAQMKVAVQNAAIAVGSVLAPAIVGFATVTAERFDQLAAGFKAIGVIVEGVGTIVVETFRLLLGQMQDFAAKALRLAAETAAKFGLDSASISLGGASISLQAEANKRLVDGSKFFDGEGFKAALEGQTEQLRSERQKQAELEKQHQETMAGIRDEGNSSELDQNAELQGILNERKAEQDQKELEDAEKKREEKLQREQEQFDEDMELLQERLELAQAYKDTASEIEITQEMNALSHKAELAGLETKLRKKTNDDMVKIVGGRVKAEESFNQALQDSSFKILGQIVGDNKAAQAALFLIQKAIAISKILISAKEAAMLAYASQLIPGDPTSFARAKLAYAATIATGTANAAATAATALPELAGIAFGAKDGGIVPGGFGGGDRVPFMLEPGEIVVPQRLNPLSPNFDQSFGAGSGGAGLGGGQNVRVMIGLEENASRVLTVKQREDTALGIQR